MEVSGSTSDGYHTFDELYAHRHHLFAVILNDHANLAFKTHKTQDGRSLDGWFIAGLYTPFGQITYHMPDEWWDRLPTLRVVEQNADYDGHTSNDVLERLRQLAESRLKLR